VSQWPSTKARRVFAALLNIEWRLERQSGSHRTLARDGWPDFVFAFHDGEEIGPKMLSRIAKHTGLEPNNLQLLRQRDQPGAQPDGPVRGFNLARIGATRRSSPWIG
jgi:predicted RNA binding protein YcfA (HicA-like mRNA interferase family)